MANLPIDDLVATHLDAATDDPSQARAQIYALLTKVQAMLLAGGSANLAGSNDYAHISQGGNSGGLYVQQISGDVYLASNAEYNGSNWIARGVIAVIIKMMTSATGQMVIYVDTGLTSGNSFTPTEIVGIDTSSVNMAKGQLKFPATQNASTNVNTLDDYREGTWTPALTFGGATTGWVLATVGNYVKIGRLVIATYSIFVTTKGSAAGACNMTGLPFAVVAGTPTYAGCAVALWLTMNQNLTQLTFLPSSSTALALLYGATAATGSLTARTDAAFQNNSEIRGTLTYIADF